MSYSADFLTALSSGSCMVRRIMPNPKRPGQVSVQFMQEVQRPGEGGLVAFAQDVPATTKLTAILSFAATKLQKLGVAAGNYHDGSRPVLSANDLFGQEVNISVLENTSPNPNRPNQTPKTNPETGLVVTKGGLPVYRHTELTTGTPSRSFLTDVDKVAVPATAASPAIDSAPF